MICNGADLNYIWPMLLSVQEQLEHFARITYINISKDNMKVVKSYMFISVLRKFSGKRINVAVGPFSAPRKRRNK